MENPSSSAGSWPSTTTVRESVGRLIRQRPQRSIALGLAFSAMWLTGIVIALGLGWMPYELRPYIVLGVIATAAFVLCDNWPLLGLVMVGVASVWSAGRLDVPGLGVVPLLIGASLATARGLRMSAAGTTTAFFGLFTLFPVDTFSVRGPNGIILAIDSLADYHPSSRILSAVVLVCSLLLGAAANRQRRSLERLRERNDELIRLREADAARISAEERTRIAREIHDVVAHHVSAMVIRAQAATRVADSNPEELRDSVLWIASNGKEALGAMRQAVRVLRLGDAREANPSAEPFLRSLEAVVDRVRSAGFDVELSATTVGGFSTMQELAILRIAQEALTNVMLHSDASAATVRLTSERGDAVLTVEDDGRNGNAPSLDDTIASGGSGIHGMRERAEALNGSLSAGPILDGGWLVEARLPAAVPLEAAR